MSNDGPDEAYDIGHGLPTFPAAVARVKGLAQTVAHNVHRLRWELGPMERQR